MSTDRRRPASNAPAKPLTPRLAASATPTRPLPAPKLAGYASPSPSTSTTSTSSRRPLSTNISEANINIATRPLDGDSDPSKDLTGNITPRSLARKSRADSVQFTPPKPLDDSPAQRRPVSVLSPANVGKSRAPLYDDKTASESNRLSSPASFATRVQQGQGYPLSPLGPATAPVKNDAASTSASEDKDSYFFRANDIQKEQSAPRPTLHKHTTSFVYANGKRETSPEPASGSHASSPAQSRPVSFARSDSAPHVDIVSPSAPGLLNLTSRPTLSPPPQAAPAAGLRAPSPPRQGIHLSYRKGISQIIRPSPLSPNAQAQAETRRRQSSIDGVDNDERRSRTLSVSSSGSQAANRKDNLGSLQQAFTFPVPTTFSSAVSPTTFSADKKNGDALKPLDTALERLTQSPSEAIESADSPMGMNEAAANARRERKVLDLQISNSSLLAINKSLEKEVRKQKVELRRYRRMSRLATRESLISQASGLSDGQFSTIGQLDDGLASDIVEEEDEDGEDEDEPDQEDTDSEDMGDDDPTSPGAISQREVRHLKSDQRRLAVDLAKHKELLADSQRMNQSILKCLNVTEQLIKDGTRALDYQVPLDEIRLGGRVLSPEEQEDGDVSYFSERQVEEDAHDEQRAQRHDDIVQEVLESADALHMGASGGVGETY